MIGADWTLKGQESVHKGVQHYLATTASEETNDQAREDLVSFLTNGNTALEDHFNNLNETLRQELNVNLKKMLEDYHDEKKEKKRAKKEKKKKKGRIRSVKKR